MTDTRLSPLDSELVHLDNAGHATGLVVATLCEGPKPDVQRLRDRVERLLPAVPRFSAVPRAVPLAVERPVWVESPDFSSADHVAAIHVDGRDLVDAGVEQLATASFDATRPRWTISIMSGKGKRWLLAAHVHLSLVDGLQSTDLYSCVLAPGVTPPPPGKAYEPTPGGPQLLLTAVRDLLTSPYEQVRALRSLVRRVRPEPALPPPVEVHRGRLSLRLGELKAVKDAHGGSVNDVLGALVAGAVGEVDGKSAVTVTVPFAVRSLNRPGQYDNQVEAVDAVLAVDGPVVEHYKAVARRLDVVARENLAVGGRLLGRVSAATPIVLLALGARACVTATSDAVLVNVPGVPNVGKVFDGRSVSAHAVVPHPPQVRWCVTSLSHGGEVSVAVSGPTKPEVAAVVAAMKRRADTLVASVST